MGGQVSGVVPVAQVQGNNVIVSLPFVGFGSRQPRQGEMVAVICDGRRAVVYPHTQSTVVERLPDSLAGQLMVDGRPMVFAEDVTRDDSGPGDRYALFYSENEASDTPPQVVAIRRVP